MSRLEKKIEQLINFTPEEIKFVDYCIDELIRLLNTVNFNHAFIALRPVQTNGKTMVEVYRDVMEGKDRQGISDNLMNLYLTGYYKSNGTIAITTMSTGKIMINRFFLIRRMNRGNKGIAEFINTLFHEYLHTLGYIHKNAWPFLSRYKSMVYQAGNLVENLYISEKNGVQFTKLISGGIL